MTTTCGGHLTKGNTPFGVTNRAEWKALTHWTVVARPEDARDGGGVGGVLVICASAVRPVCRHWKSRVPSTRCGRELLVSAAMLLSGFSGGIHAQQAVGPPVDIQRLNTPILFDGYPFDEAWEGIDPLPMVQHLPTFGAEPSERTDVRVTYDDDYLYVGARLYDSDPKGIRPGSLKRNRRGNSNDWITVTLDTFNDKENTLLFGTSPAGSRTDAWITSDAEGDSPINGHWDTFWDVKVTRNENGWFAEFRIPFSSLRFQSNEAGRVVMGLMVWRWIARKEEAILFPAVPPNWRLAHYKPSQHREIVLRGIDARRPIYATPYGLAGRERRVNTSSGPNGADLVTRHPAYEAGLDMKVGLGSRLTLDLTVNTDFAQVEVDDQQINLTRFNLFFPEKRRFFQEQQGAFEFQTGRIDRVFHSRRIGLRAGEAVRIYGGGRVVGQVGPWEFGALNMQTAASEGSAGENLGTYRFRRRIVNRYSYLGGILTNRIDKDGNVNIVYGTDGRIRFSTRSYVSFRWAQSYDNTGGDGAHIGWNTALARLQWERRGFDGFGFDLSATRVGRDYAPGIGFVQRRGHLRLGDNVSWGWRPSHRSRILRHVVSLQSSIYVRHLDRTAESVEVEPEWRAEARRGYVFALGGRYTRELLGNSFHITQELEVPPGDYQFHALRASLRTPSGGVYRFAAALDAGQFFNGRRFALRLSPAWLLAPHVELSGDYEFDRIKLARQGQELTAHVMRMRSDFFVNTVLSINTFLQYNSAAGLAGMNLRLRYNPREGDDIYVVWNEDWNTHRYQMDPHLPRVAGRTLAIKVARTFSL